MIADDTQAEAVRFTHGSVDTVHVLTGQADGTDHARNMVDFIAWENEAQQPAHNHAPRRHHGIQRPGQPTAETSQPAG